MTGAAGLIGGGAAAGLLAGLALYRWLRTAGYRRPDDQPRLDSARAGWVVPITGGAGAVAGMVASPMAGAVWVFLTGAVALSWIDVDVHRVPDRVLVVWAPLVVAATGLAAAWVADWSPLTGGLIGALAWGGLLVAMALLGSMGMGDVKLGAVAGFLLGALQWPGAVVTGALGTAAAAAVIALGLLLRGADRHTHLPYAPAITVGAAAAVLLDAVTMAG